MDKEIIEKVLRCRASIDRHRNWLADKFAESEAAIALAISKLPEKDRDSEARIAEIAMAEKIPDHDRAVDVERMLVQLQAEGFAGIIAYARWDEEKCFEAYLDLAPVENECSVCRRYDKTVCDGLLESAKRYTFYHTLRERVLGDNKLIIALAYDGKLETALCPEGYVFHRIKAVEDMTKKSPFDLSWEVFV